MWKLLGPYILVFITVALVAPWIGPEAVTWRSVWNYVAGTGDPGLGHIFFTLRVPRVWLALLAGGTLAVSGAALQVLFRNPLVEPYTLGITGGASLGAFLTIAFPALAVSVGPFHAVVLFSLLGAAATLGVIYRLASEQAGLALPTLLLAGISVSVVCMGAIVLITYLTTPHKLMVFQRWVMGGLGTVGYRDLAAVLPLLVPGVGMLLYHARALTHLALGEEMARGQGVEVGLVQRQVFLGAGLGTAAVVGAAGPIAFVGLIVPHAVRRLSGVDQMVVLPASFLAGGAVLALCDCLARTVLAPTELPVGIITSVAGGPLFIYLLIRSGGGGKMS